MEIDDAAVLKRSKHLCEQDGVAWHSLSVTGPGARVLNDRDRRECLMRARDELVREAIEAGTSEEPVQNEVDGRVEAPSDTGEQTKDLDFPPAKAASFWPKRRVA
jgi:hypothetical protein